MQGQAVAQTWTDGGNELTQHIQVERYLCIVCESFQRVFCPTYVASRVGELSIAELEDRHDPGHVLTLQLTLCDVEVVPRHDGHPIPAPGDVGKGIASSYAREEGTVSKRYRILHTRNKINEWRN